MFDKLKLPEPCHGGLSELEIERIRKRLRELAAMKSGHQSKIAASTGEP